MTQIQDLFDAESVTLADEFICGYLPAEGGEVSFEFIVEAMSGEAEDVIDGKGPKIPIFNRFILLCLKSIGSYIDRNILAKAVEQMTTLDRMIALIAIRRATHGNVYNMIVNMPDDCEDETRRFNVDLSTLERRPMVEPEKRKRVDTVTLDTPKGPAEYKIHWHIMIGADEMWAEKVQVKTKGESNQTIRLLTRLDGITRVGKEGQADLHIDIPRGRILADSRMMSEQLKKSLAIVKGIPATLRRMISALIDNTEGDIDVIMEFDYKNEEGEDKSFKTVLDPTQREFFFPRAQLPSSTTMSFSSASSGT